MWTIPSLIFLGIWNHRKTQEEERYNNTYTTSENLIKIILSQGPNCVKIEGNDRSIIRGEGRASEDLQGRRRMADNDSYTNDNICILCLLAKNETAKKMHKQQLDLVRSTFFTFGNIGRTEMAQFRLEYSHSFKGEL